MSLTAGGIQLLLSSDSKHSKPILQIIEIAETRDKRRFKMALSDGKFYWNKVILSSQATSVNVQETLPYAIVQIDDYLVNTLQNNKILVILQLSVKQAGGTGIIGKPQKYEEQQRSVATALPPFNPDKFAQFFQWGSTGALRRRYFNRQSAIPERKADEYNGKITRLDQVFIHSSVIVKVRILTKSPIKQWKKENHISQTNTAGIMFIAEAIDASMRTVKLVCFNLVAEALFPILQEDHIYYISGASINARNPMYARSSATTGRQSVEFDMIISNHEMVEQAGEDPSIPFHTTDYFSLQQLPLVQPQQILNTLAIVDKVEECKSVSTYMNCSVSRRLVTLIDEYDTEGEENQNLPQAVTIQLALWDHHAEKCTLRKGDAVMITDARKSAYGGHSLNTTNCTSFQRNPESNTVSRLQKWYKQVHPSIPESKIAKYTVITKESEVSAALKNAKTIRDVLSFTGCSVEEGMTVFRDYLINATIAELYQELNVGSCSSCMAETRTQQGIGLPCGCVSHFVTYLRASMCIQDHTGCLKSVFLTSSALQSLIHMDLQQLVTLKEQHPDQFMMLMSSVSGEERWMCLRISHRPKYGQACLDKETAMQDNPEYKFEVLNIVPLQANYHENKARRLLSEIEHLEATHSAKQQA